MRAEAGPTQTGMLDVPSSRLWWDRRGEGPPVVLLHGFSLDHRCWDGLLPALTGREVVRYDLRGFGRSDLPGELPFRHVDDLAALLDALGLDRVDLVGLSLGGAVAVDLAIEQPDRVGALLAVDAALVGHPGTPAGGGGDWRAWRVGRAEGIEAARALWLQHPLFAPALANPRSAPLLRQMIADYSGWAWAHDVPLRPLDPPAAERLGAIRARTLALTGELDVPDFQAIADRLAREIPGACRAVIPGVGHLPNLEAPEAFGEVARAFLGP